MQLLCLLVYRDIFAIYEYEVAFRECYIRLVLVIIPGIHLVGLL